MNIPHHYQKLFEKMAANLAKQVENGQIVINPHPDISLVACPLCLRLFSLDDLNRKILTPEHVPPEKMGGKVETLTCKECNHPQGASLEGPLMNRLRYEEFGRLTIDMAAESKMEFLGHTINTQITFLGDNTFRFDFDPAKSPREHEDIVRNLAVGQSIGELKIIPKKKYQEKPSSLGLLRIAYLKAFLALGYEYICHKNLEIIRNQLSNPKTDLLSDYGDIDKAVPENFPSIGLVMDPEHLKSIFVCIDLKSEFGTKFRYAVLLPITTANGLKIYDELAKIKQLKNWPHLTIRPLALL